MRTTGWLGWRKSADAGLGRRIADFAGVLFLTGLLVGGSCTSNDATKGPSFPSTIVSGTAGAIVLTVSSSNVKCGSTITVTATVLSSTGQPVASVTVLFETSKGSVSPTSTSTDSSGQATTTYTASSSLISECGTGTATTATVIGTARTSTGTTSDSIGINIVP